MKYPDLFNPDLSRMGAAESQMYNLIAGELVTRIARTALGPRGMSKVYIDILDEETVTSHGGAFLRKVDVDHPAAKAVVDAVNAVDNHVGDGTTTAAVLVGALLRHAKEMRAMRVPTASIIHGYEAGLETALRDLDGLRVFCGFDGSGGGGSSNSAHAVLRRIIECCMAGSALLELTDGSGTRGADRDAIKPAGNDCGGRHHGMMMADMIFDAVLHTSDLAAGRSYPDDVKIEEKQGNAPQTALVYGTVIDKPVDDGGMPRAISDARILLVSEPLERSRTKTESEITITAPGQMGSFLRQESEDVRRIVDGVIACGANVVISRKGIDAEAQEALAKRGIMSVRRVKHNDIWWLEKSTGASTCTDIEAIADVELGHADRVYERSVGGDRMIFVESDPRPGRGRTGSVTILLRATSKRYLDEFHRDVLNALHAAQSYAESQYVVYGGGSCEALLAHGVRAKSYEMAGKEQVAFMRFADALEDIPAALAENAGMQTLDALPRLRRLVRAACRDDGGTDGCRAKGPDDAGRRRDGARTPRLPQAWYGIDPETRDVQDMSPSGCNIIEPYAVKAQVLKSAVEAACVILNVDDVFVKDLIDNTHCHIDGTVHAHKDPGRNHNHWEQEGLEQRQMHHYY